jgi:protein-disulfide isomerase
MSYPGTGNYPDVNSRRDEAREKARAIREAHKKQDKRTRGIVQATVALFSVAVLGIVAIVVLSSMRTDGPGPLNMRSDGIEITKGFVATTTPAIQPGADPVPTVHDPESDVISIRVYTDYFCTLCGQFEKVNGSQLDDLLNSGAATVEVHPIAILDRVSQGTKYSTRAANAAACVANFAPDQFYDFHHLLFAKQPEENSPGLTDEELVGLALTAKAASFASVKDCITEQTFRSWVTDSRDRALTGPLPDADIESITGTPTIIVNGFKYPGAINDAKAFASFVVKAAGATFTENSTATPTPTPEPTPTK